MRLLYSNSRRIVRAAGSLLFIPALLLASACNSADSTADNSQNFTTSVALSTHSISVPIGDSTQIAVSVTRGGGYTDAVTLTLDDTLPVGVTGTFSPQVLGIGGTASILTLTAASTALQGTTPIKLRLSGFDVVDDTTTIQLTVVSAAISVTAGATTASASIGGSATIPLTFERLNGYTGPIYPTAEGVPANVTATFTPALVQSGVNSSTLILSPLPGAVVGTSTITVRVGGSPGVIEKTTPFSFTISSPTGADFLPSASPAAITVAPGATASSVISLNRVGGFVSGVSLALSGLPAGVTAAFGANPATGTNTTLVFTATSAAALGKYNMTLTGTAVGGAPHTIPLVLTIAPPTGIDINLINPTLTIAKGGIGQSALLATRVGGVIGDIALSADSLPTGVVGTFSTVTLSGATSGSVLGISVSSSTNSGTYSIIVRGTTTAGVTGASTLTLIVP